MVSHTPMSSPSIKRARRPSPEGYPGSSFRAHLTRPSATRKRYFSGVVFQPTKRKSH
jgi:hypothetical protein